MTDTDALWIGIDVGTQSVKAAVIDSRGRVHATATSPLHSSRETRSDGNRHEQDPAEWVGSTREALARAVQSIPLSDRERIAGVAVCATSGSIAVVDGDGHPVSSGIMYDDARAGALSDEVARAAPALWKRLGYRIQPTWALPKMLWLARNGQLPPPSSVRQATADERYVAHQADAVTASLVGGRVASDWSHALKSGYDLLSRRWPGDALRRLGLDEASLPAIVAPGTVLGHIDPLTSGATAIPQGTPVFAGMTDGCAAQLGAAAIGLGDAHTVVGTTMVVKSVSSELVSDDGGAVYSHLSPEGTVWLPGGASNVGAGILTELFPGADLDALTSAVESRYGRGSAAALPFSYPLPGTGERFPVIAPSARGFVVVGGREYPLSDAKGELDRIETYAALLVGVACVERLALERLAESGADPSGTITSSGGGTKNAWWVQLRSDLLGRQITVSATADGSTGMAVLAAWAGQPAGPSLRVPLAQIAAQMSHSDTTYRPDPQRSEQLDAVYGAFLAAVSKKGWGR